MIDLKQVEKDLLTVLKAHFPDRSYYVVLMAEIRDAVLSRLEGLDKESQEMFVKFLGRAKKNVEINRDICKSFPEGD